MRKGKRGLAGCLGAALLCLGGFAVAAEPAVPQPLVSAYTDFGFNLFAEVGRRDAGKNVFISAPSVAFALAMTYNGANGETARAMAETLRLKGMSRGEANRANAALKALLQDPGPGVALAIANSLWARQDVSFKPEFLERNKKSYGAKVAVLDFADPAAPATINAWVSENTKGKIEDIVNKIPRSAILYLINAIYFKGDWTNPFDEAKTRERPFHLADGSQKMHPMMARSGYYRHYRGPDFQAVSLPYGEGRLSMYVFLPDEGGSLLEFQKRLNAESWSEWMSQFRMAEGEIVLPRLKLRYEARLNDMLGALGMEVAFDPDRADFGDMCTVSERVLISEVKHKTFVEVNEKGTEAAAATSVETRAVSGLLYQFTYQFTMVVDRPFFFAIRDDKTGLVLFMGSIVEPEVDAATH